MCPLPTLYDFIFLSSLGSILCSRWSPMLWFLVIVGPFSERVPWQVCPESSQRRDLTSPCRLDHRAQNSSGLEWPEPLRGSHVLTVAPALSSVCLLMIGALLFSGQVRGSFAFLDFLHNMLKTDGSFASCLFVHICLSFELVADTLSLSLL